MRLLLSQALNSSAHLSERFQMNKFNTEQLKTALIGFSKLNDEDSNAAFQITFDELHKRMGDEAFDKFLDENGM